LPAARAQAQDTELWISYRLPANPDLASAARLEEAKARTQRTITLSACATTPSVADCPRQAEITFRGYLMAIPGIEFRLNYGPRGALSWLLNVRDQASDPNWDQNLSQLDGRLAYQMGVHVDAASRQLIRDSDSRPVRLNRADQALVDQISSMIALKRNAHTQLESYLRQRGLWDAAALESVYFLVEHGGNPESNICCPGYSDGPGRPVKFYTRSLLYAAVVQGDPRLVRLLIERGANVNSTGGPAGSTPLMAAAGAGNLTLVKTLLDLGAQAAIKDERDETALQKAEKAGHADVAALLRQRGGG
jgi:hypothetical protein